VPYFISGHPGSTLKDMVDLALWLKSADAPAAGAGLHPHAHEHRHGDVHTGIDPLTRTPVYTARDLYEKKLQKALLLYWDPAHHELAREALVKAGRADLIGTKPMCRTAAAGTSSATGRAAWCRPPRARARWHGEGVVTH
jgi:radical SAM superfamily enzyme YgiQ (UPF0313 family)